MAPEPYQPPPALAGQQMDHYQILSLLGKGGMGEVYLARDARLGRDVAVKVLPPAFAADAARLLRFEQESQAAGKLNHPNVLTVFDVGVCRGAPYIVTELLEGEELRAQLRHAAIPMRRALEYAQQIASGLAAAHAKGIVHRDLKPENLFVTTDGRVKILDFGLAKLKPPPSASGAATALESITEPGMVMGTVGYMAPEQVRGEETDHRADLFAFGVILYEILTGAWPFSGDSAVAVMNAILTQEPPELTDTIPTINPAVAKTVRRCLEKKPERRFQSASDLSFTLEAFLASPSSSVHPRPAAATQRSRRHIKWLGASVSLLAAAGVLAWHLNRSDYWWRNPLMHAEFTPLTDFPGAEGDAVISPDGKFTAFLSDRDGATDAWTGQIGTGEFQNLTKGRAPELGNPRVRNLAFSPDGSQVTMEVRHLGRISSWTVPTMGGPVRPYIQGGELAWSPDGTQMILAIRSLLPGPTKGSGSRSTWQRPECIAITFAGHRKGPGSTLFRDFRPMKWMSGGFAQRDEPRSKSPSTTRASPIRLCSISECSFTQRWRRMARVPGCTD